MKHGFSVWDPDAGLSVSSLVTVGSASWARGPGFGALSLSFGQGQHFSFLVLEAINTCSGAL